MIETSRRSLIFGGAALICAPAIVRYSSLMPVKVLPNDLVYGQSPAAGVLESLHEFETFYVRNEPVLKWFIETPDRKWFELISD